MNNLTDKKILITGAPRAATLSTATFLQELGISIGHEKDMDNGTVSSLHTHLNKNYDTVLHQIRDPLKSIKSLHKLKWISFDSFSEIPDDVYNSDKLLMNYLTLSEINNINSKDSDSIVHIRRWKEMVPKIKDRNLTRQCMKAWLQFNIEAETSSSWSYRIEDLSRNDIFKKWIEELGVEYKEEYFEKYNNSDSSKEIIHSQLGYSTQNPPLTWEILKELDLELTNRIITYAKHKGYNI